MNYYIGSMMVTPYLEHHGILGMKWGQRNGPPYPLNSEDHSKAEKEAGWRKSLGASGKETNVKKTKMAQHDVSNKKDKPKKEANKKLTDLEKIQRTKKVATALAIAGGVALASVAAYSLYDNYKLDNFDFILNSDVDLKRISANPEFNEGKRAFYAAFDAKDVDKYAGYYGGGQLRQKVKFMNALDGGDRKVYQKTIDIVNNIKVPSRKTAEQVFKEMYNDSGESGSKFRQDLQDISKFFRQANPFAWRNDISKLDLDDKDDLKSAYALFNQALVYHGDPTHDEFVNKFYDKLKSMGYGAVLDLNDREFSGYNAKRPMIIFDTKNVAEKMVKELDDVYLDEMFNHVQINEANEAAIKELTDKALKSSIALSGTVAVTAAVTERKYKKEQAQTKKDDKKVAS